MRKTRLLTSGLVVAALCGWPLEAPAQTPAPRLASSTRTDVSTILQGNALTSTNGSLPDATLRLRDARLGRIVGTTTTDKLGFFSFRVMEPGSYIVELIGADQALLAASQILNINSGDRVSAIVKLPFRIQPLAGVLGHTVQSAAIVTATAAASGVLALAVAGSDVTPRK
jgi:hypothetical protein